MKAKTKMKRARVFKKMGRRADRINGLTARPTKTNHQVFVSNGKKFHTQWCDAMNGVWLSGSNAVRAIDFDESAEDGMEMCGLCVKIEHIQRRFEGKPSDLDTAERHLDAIANSKIYEQSAP